jgi:hypothetical protein
MRIRRGFLNWGIFLVCLGAVPAAVQLGVLDRGLAGDLLRLWPLILVGIGLGLLLRFTAFEALGGIVVAGTLGLLFGVLLSGGFPSSLAACGSGPASGPEVNREGAFSGDRATLSVELSCADVEVGRAPGETWSVQAITADGNPRIDFDDHSLSLRSRQDGAFIFPGSGRERWHVSLPAQPALAMSATLNASSGTMSLGNGPLEQLNATFNASDLRVDLSGPADNDAPRFVGTLNASSVTLAMPDADVTGNITLNASSLTLCAPPAAGLSITYEDTLSSHNFADAGLAGADRAWQTPDYASAASQISLDLNANVSSITVDRSGGCP